MATYLELVNEVLVRLREQEVGSVTGTYPTLVGSFVNQAKEWAERKHDWQCLRVEKTITTAAGTAEYNIPDTNRHTRLYKEWDARRQQYMPLVWITTAGEQGLLRQQDLGHWREARYTDSISTNVPSFFVVLGRGTDNQMKVGLIDEPDGIYSINVTLIQPEATLITDAQETEIPKEVIVQYAYALAFSERGEDGGATSDETFFRAGQILQEYISLESSWVDHEFTLRAE